MRHYTTLFDINYAAHGLALLASLHKHSTEDFILHILPMDRETYTLLADRQGKGFLTSTIVEDPSVTEALIASVPRDRTWGELCWTMASVYTRYVYERLKTEVTYLDSDVFFFDDPKIMFNIMNLWDYGKNVAIVDHNFPAHDYDRLIGNGKFNVSIVTFKYSQDAHFTLNRWAKQCINKCDKYTCGDQKYLDEWPAFLTSALHIHDGKQVGLGPWRAYTYRFTKENNKILINGERYLNSYHFHETRHIEGQEYKLTGYQVTTEQKELIYDPYIKMLIFFQDIIDKRNEVSSA